MEKEKDLQVEETVSTESSTKKKSRKWLWITIALIALALVAAWCIISIINYGDGKQAGLNKALAIPALLTGVFIVTALGYMFGRITIKGVSLGTAGVFIVAILFGVVCYFIPADIPVLGAFSLQAVGNSTVLDGPVKELGSQLNTLYYSKVLQNIGLVLFVGAVGFIAGPKFFRDLAKNFKTYILMGVLIILSGTAVAVVFALIPGIGSSFSSGVLSGALTSTPGYSAALEAQGANTALVTLGHAVAYPFGVIGVVLFVQLLPKFLKADMNRERSLLKPDVLASKEKKAEKKLFVCDEFGFTAIAIAFVAGLIVGAIKIPLTGNGYDGLCFTLGTTGGVLIMCLVFGHFGRIGKLSLQVPEKTAKVLRELGLMLFLIGAGISGGQRFVQEFQISYFFYGMIMTILPMIVGFLFAKYILKIDLLNILGSITGGMTSTPALGTLIHVAGTEDVAAAYAATYPIALVAVVIVSQMINIIF